MPLNQRTSANVGRRAQSGAPGQVGSSSEGRNPDSRTDGRNDASADLEERLRDALRDANTRLNRALEDRDKLHNKLEESNSVTAKLKNQAQAVVAENSLLKKENQRLTDENKNLQRFKEQHNQLQYDHLILERQFSDLEAKYDRLEINYKAASAVPAGTSASTSSNNLPERPKASRTNSKKESREHRESRDERGRARDRDRKEQKAEKERLSRRFDGRPPTSQRHSFIEGWGPRGRSASATPAGRNYTNVATGRMQVPALSQSHATAFSNVPRTTTIPMSPGGFYSSGGSSATYDEEFEAGDYRPYPIAR